MKKMDNTNRIRSQRMFLSLLISGFLALSLSAQQQWEEVAMEQVQETGRLIREAFARQDIEAIAKLHHPDVIKAIGFNNVQQGRDAVMDALRDTFGQYRLEFVENTLENALVRDSLVVEQTVFAIQGTPKSDGEPFVFKGRTQVTYVRWEGSPTGWAGIREIIQVASGD